MNKIFVLRQNIKDFYSSHDAWLSPLLKAAFMLVIILVINSHIGYSQALTSWNIVLLAVLLSAILPWQGMTFIGVAFVIINLFAMSWEVGIIGLILIMLFAITQYVFIPGYGITIVLIPIAYYLHVPFAIPLILGVMGGVSAFIPSTLGCYFYYFLSGIEKNADFFLRTTGGGASEQIPQIFTILTENNLMLISIIAFCAAPAIVGMIKKRSTDFAPYIAIAVGTIVSIVIYLIGGLVADVNIDYLEVFLGGIGSFIIAFAVILWMTAVDYDHSEFLEYEDENYVYKVKAIPKVKVVAKEVKVREITNEIKVDEEDKDKDIREVLKELEKNKSGEGKVSDN